VWVFLEWKGSKRVWVGGVFGGGGGFGFQAAARRSSPKSDAGGNEYIPKKMCVLCVPIHDQKRYAAPFYDLRPGFMITPRFMIHSKKDVCTRFMIPASRVEVVEAGWVWGRFFGVGAVLVWKWSKLALVW